MVIMMVCDGVIYERVHAARQGTLCVGVCVCACWVYVGTSTAAARQWLGDSWVVNCDLGVVYTIFYTLRVHVSARYVCI